MDQSILKTIAFIILNYRSAETTIGLVDALLTWKQDRFLRRIVVVDNCSPDDSFELLRQRYSDAEAVTVLQSERNGGYSYGNNFGCLFAIERYHPAYIAIANPDIVVDEATVAALLDTFTQDEKLCACSPVMRNPQGQGGAFTNRLPTYRVDLRCCFGEIRPKSGARNKKAIRRSNEYLNGHPETVLTEMLPGSFFVVRTDLYQAVGMLDENVFLFCEERIFGFRCKQAGLKLAIRSDLSFLHIHGVSIGKSLKALRTRRILLDSRYYYEKTYNQEGALRLLWLRIVMWASLAAMFLIGIASSAVRKLRGLRNK